MTHSLGEIEALSKRAARGAGLSWGMAEEAGKAVRWLAAYQLPGVAGLAALLKRNDGTAHDQIAPVSLGKEWAAAGGMLCPLASGSTLTDCAGYLADDRITMRQVSHPLLLLPFAAWIASDLRASVRLAWGDVQLTTDGQSLWVNGADSDVASPVATAVSCSIVQLPRGAGQQPTTRGQVDTSAWAQLHAFAHRTYAPATEASRLLGAGAGVSDND